MKVNELGVMIDLSRGKALNIETIKRLALNAKAFGYTYINLYIEDLITLEEYPAYGYLRGKFSDDEVHEIVTYCDSINLEVYPAIQTLGHLEHFLGWEQSQKLKDTDQVLNVINNETKIFLETLIKKCNSLFSSTKINIGMDEAFDLGQGRLSRTGNTLSQKELYLNHLDTVVKICKDNDFETIKVWSDMLFNVYSNAGGEGLYSVSNGSSFEQLNNNVELIYWNYWSRIENEYLNTLEIHQKFTNNISIALGIHTWGLPFYNSEQLNITKIALNACKQKGIKDILFTMWGDDGSLFNIDSGIYGMYLSAITVKGEQSNPKFFEQVTGLNYSSLERVSKICDCGINPLHILWNDPITNIKLNSLTAYQISQIEHKTNEMLITPRNINEEVYNLYLICMLNEINLYKHDTLSLEMIEIAIKDLRKLFKFLEELWISEAKLYGIEELQSRFNNKIYRYQFLYKHQSNPQIISERSKWTGIKPIAENYSSLSKATKFRW